MKKVLLLFVLFLSVNVFAQSTNESSVEDAYEEKVDVAAEFPGGIHSFRAEFAKNMNINKVKGKGKFRTEITFVVERDGTISNIKAMGDNESLNEQAIKAIKKITTKWNPAKVNGVKVRSRFRFPSTVNV